MIFNSVTFLLFLLTIVGLYWVLPTRPRLWLLFLGSLTFYGFWRVEFLPVMLFSTVVDYVASLQIDKSEDPRRRKLWLAFSLVSNLGLLFVFKYLLFTIDNVYSVAGVLGMKLDPVMLRIVLPIGISFYTFQTISYTVDVYRGFIRPERDFILYGCYVTYFPQLVAGPVLRASEVLPQLAERPPFLAEDLADGVRRVLLGLLLKVCLADPIGGFVDTGYAMNPSLLSALDVWTLAFLFGLQIYFDFSAYSHIALGCARMMGVHFPENFNFPYAADSPREFWQRWHISLSSWIRDYLYLPLAGARVRDRSTGGLAVAVGEPGKQRKNLALFSTWAIMGLWHGAAWTFVFWGVYHAVFIFIYRQTEPLRSAISRYTGRWHAALGWAFTLPVMMLSWIPFRAESMAHMLVLYGRLFVPSGYLWLGMRENVYLVTGLLTLGTGVAYLFHTRLWPRLQQHPPMRLVLESSTLAVIVFLVVVFLRPISQFIYFQF